MAAKTCLFSDVADGALARDALRLLDGFSPKLILFFASSLLDGADPARQLADAFPQCRVVGCTSHSEYNNGTFAEGSVSLLALDAGTVENFHIEIHEHISTGTPIKENLQRVHTYFDGYDTILNHFDRYVGIVLFDGVCKAQEHFMDMLGMATEILYVGGTASYTEPSGICCLYLDGKRATDAAVLITLKTTRGYSILQTQSAKIFKPNPFTATKSDLKTRVITELDGRPAAAVCAEAIGVPLEELEAHWESYPLGVIAENDVFLRTFSHLLPGGGVSMFCGVAPGTQLHMMHTGDIIAGTRMALADGIPPHAAAVINFNCLHRTTLLRENGTMASYCALWGRWPGVGFSCLGEEYLGHMNQTSTVLALK